MDTTETSRDLRSIDQSGVKPGPAKLEQFREACRIAGLPDRATGWEPGEGPSIARLKLFNPAGAGTWLLSDWDSSDDSAFGWCHLGDDRFAELGYVSLEELAEYRGHFGLGIEIDVWFEPAPMAQATRHE